MPETEWPVTPVDKDAAAAALRSAAGDGEEIHSFLYTGPIAIGADHDLEGALLAVEQADEIAWTTDWMNHDLAVRVDDKVYHYDVERPERSTS